MTVKIIFPGIRPEDKIIPGKCNYCKCQFTFNPGDAKLVPDSRDGAYYSIDCPTCKRQCTVNSTSI